MDLIESQYKSDEEEKAKPPVLGLPDRKRSLAPPVAGTEQTKLNRFDAVSAAVAYENLPFEQMYAPQQGPARPGSAFANAGNALKGDVEKFSMDDFSFEENFLTFKNFGYAADPSLPGGGRVAGDGERFRLFGGATVFRGNPLRAKKYRRPEREKKGDPSEVDGYKGPWARFREDEELLEELAAKQRRMKELFERGKREEEGAKPEEAAPAEARAAVVIEGAAKPVQEIDAARLSDCAKESSVFEYTHERDYQGRTYMHCPHEFRGGEQGQRCFIPTKRVHTWHGHTKGVSAIRWFPRSGHVLLSASMDKSVKLWDVNGHRRCLRTITGHGKGVRDVTFNADGTRFLSVGLDQWTKLWDTETGQVIARFSSGVQAQCARFYPLNENEFLAAQSDKLVVGWDVRRGEIMQKYDEHLKAVNALAFIDQSRKFVSSADDKKIFIWEYGIPVVVNHISEPYMNSVPFLAESPDGEWFLGQSMDNSVVVYSAADKRHHRKRRYIGHSSHGHACQVDVSPDGQFIVSGDSEGKAFFWDWKTKKIYKRLNAHSKVTIGAIWHPVHASKVATCSWDATIKLWD